MAPCVIVATVCLPRRFTLAIGLTSVTCCQPAPAHPGSLDDRIAFCSIVRALVAGSAPAGHGPNGDDVHVDALLRGAWSQLKFPNRLVSEKVISISLTPSRFL